MECKKLVKRVSKEMPGEYNIMLVKFTKHVIPVSFLTPSLQFPHSVVFPFDHISMLSGQGLALQKRRSLAEIRMFNQSFSRQHEPSANTELSKMECHSNGNS